MKKVGWFLLVASFLPWLTALAIPLLPLTIAQKVAIAPVLFLVGEGLFWVGALLVGKDVAARYRRWFNPRLLWRRVKRILHKRVD